MKFSFNIDTWHLVKTWKSIFVRFVDFFFQVFEHFQKIRAIADSNGDANFLYFLTNFVILKISTRNVFDHIYWMDIGNL